MRCAMYQTRGEDRRRWDPSVSLPVGFVDRRCVAERRRPDVREASLAEFDKLMKSFGDDGKKDG